MCKIYKNTIKTCLMLLSHNKNQSYEHYVICGLNTDYYAFSYD